MKTIFPMLFRFAIALLFAVPAAISVAAEIRVIEPGSEPEITGKEVDWIYGDYLIENDQIALVVAAPLPTRDANMTVRNVGGSILDLTLKSPSNDQLSAYTPTAGRYLFHDPTSVQIERDGDSVVWQTRSSRTLRSDGTTATVRYRLTDGNAFLEATVLIEGAEAAQVRPYDGVRADGWFEFEASENTAYCTDAFFRQTIGFKSPVNQDPPSWKKGRPSLLRYTDGHVERTEGKLEWKVLVYPATSPLDLISVAERSDLSPAMYKFDVSRKTPVDAGVESVNRVKIVVRPKDEGGEKTEEPAELRTDDEGIAFARLVPGNYVAVASAIGYEDVEVDFEASEKGGSVSLPLGEASGFAAEVKDGQGSPIPVKATIYSVEGDNPDFGLSSARTFVQNCVYSVHGRFHCPLDPGEYEILFSRGPEYDRVTRRLQVVPNEVAMIEVQLDRVVDTTGWVSADLHSHSSPSGDNTSDQYGRVENLLCEQVEFAPCTEHNRVSSYSPHLKLMGLSHLMATCTGIELTGSPTPVNHQNAFPLHRHPHTQNGGGPRPASNPVVQIERLAMWDEASDKLVQMNHPNLHQIHGDSDADGKPDRGFRGMLQWTDVVEVHPLETLFQDIAADPPEVKRMRIPLFQWLQLLNQGHRIPGVINTDSHYNHHGSGWRRNWFASSTDDPAKISTEEMIRQIESGHIIMSTGPFLSVSAASGSDNDPVLPGDDLVAEDGRVTLKVGVQCPNWLSVNRVQVFINGRPSEQHNYTRKNSSELFGDVADVRKFDSSFELKLDQDAHVIVATIGEGMTMERVMGRRYGKRPPIAVSNPVFVDVDGNGFQHNGDELGLPLPGVSE
ncbi:MAG: CehA/McbA family metallohydrolase [Rubripirellula sp.]